MISGRVAGTSNACTDDDRRQLIMIEERMATRNELRGEVRTDSRSTPVRGLVFGHLPISLIIYFI